MNKKTIVCLDADDTLLSCNELAIQMLNEAKGYNLTIEDVTAWNECGNKADERLQYFHDIRFFERQKALPGAKEFVRKLLERGVEVVILTAVSAIAATQRIRTIREEFPEIPEKNIIITSRKDLVQCDILIDDAPHNVFDSAAKWPVLLRRPWNHNVSGFLSVGGYDEALALVDRIIEGNSKSVGESGPYVVALVGPSGSGKTAITNELCDNHSDKFAVAQSTTTRERRDTEDENAYHFIDMDTFLEMKNNGDFLETTMYAGNGYGMEKKNVDNVLASGRNAVIPLDICGALAMKARYGKQAILCFVKRRKDDVMQSILERNISNDDKYRRIISLDDEYKNAALCDYVVQNGGTIEDAAKQIIRIV